MRQPLTHQSTVRSAAGTDSSKTDRQCDPDETEGRRIERARAEWRANADLATVRRKVSYQRS